jgi:hypothetical protein
MDTAPTPSPADPQAGARSQPPGVGTASSVGDIERHTLSKFQRLSLTFSAIALVINALGFTAIIVSIRNAHEQLTYAAAQTKILIRDRHACNVLALDRVFLDHPELRPYFFEGKDLKESDPLYPKVEAVADMHLDVFSYNLEYRHVFADHYGPQDYDRYIREMLALSPVMKRRLEAKAAWFSPHLQEVLK